MADAASDESAKRFRGNAIGVFTCDRQSQRLVWIQMIIQESKSPIGLWILTPGLIVFLLMVIGAAWAAWARLKYSRVLLLLLLTVLVAMPVLEAVFYGVPFLLSTAEGNDTLWRSLGFWWSLTSSVWWLLWLTLNYWYYLGPPTRGFYSRTANQR